MRFGNPWWLPAGFLACVILAWMWRRYDARQHAALARFVSSHLRSQLTQSISVARRRAQRSLFLAALALLFVALAGPLYGYRWEQISRRGNEIVFAIDTSRSMTTPDIKPDRLSRAKLAIDDFVNRLDGDAVGIVAFAGSAFLVCPITLDYGAFHESLSAIDTNTIPHGGTNIASAIHEAQSALRRRPGSDRILILVTDGEDLEGSALAAAQAAKDQDGLRIFTVGVGTAAGDLIPVPPDQGGGFVKDETGAFVKSRLDEAALKAVAASTGGFYVPLGTQGEGLETVFTSSLGPLAKHELASRQQKIYTERYQWPLAASLGSLLASLLIGTRRRAPARRRVTTVATNLPANVAPSVPASVPAKVATGITAASNLVLLLLLSQIVPSRAATPGAAESDRANSPAAKSDPNKPEVEYNLGTTAYRAGQFPQAAQAFKQSISHAPSGDPKRLADQEDAYYNLGNTLYRTGQKTEPSDPKETLQKWTDAVTAYETALQLRANDADSKFNRDLVKRKIAALQQKQNQQQNQNPQNQNQQQNPDRQQGQGQNQQGGNGQGKPPDQPKGQPPNSPQSAKSDDQKQDQQQSPPNAAGSKADQPQQGADQPQQGGQPRQAGQPPTAPANGNPQRTAQSGGDRREQGPADDTESSDNQRLPGQMSREEARQLLDSVKGDERRAPMAPLADRDADRPPDKPIKDW